jgi:hypothetical protein
VPAPAPVKVEEEAVKKEKKKPIRYPTEDLDVKLTDKEIKSGMKIRRPIPSRTALPFGDDPAACEGFLTSYNFLAVYGYVAINIFVDEGLSGLQTDITPLCIHSRRVRTRPPTFSCTPCSAHL